MDVETVGWTARAGQPSGRGRTLSRTDGVDAVGGVSFSFCSSFVKQLFPLSTQLCTSAMTSAKVKIGKYSRSDSSTLTIIVRRLRSKHRLVGPPRVARPEPGYAASAPLHCWCRPRARFGRWACVAGSAVTKVKSWLAHMSRITSLTSKR